MTQQTIIAQISDLHIGAKPKNGVAAADGLLRAFAAMAPFRPDAILATGDLANDEGEEEYVALRELLTNAPAPVYLVPGNHDNPVRLRAAMPTHAYLPLVGPLSYVVEHLPVRIVAVDQTAPGLVGGLFTPSHADWLEGALRAAPDKPTIVALHHPPFSTHDRLFDTINLEGADLFADVIARHKQVLRIVCGHHHRLTVGSVAHAPVMSAPSTAWAYSLALSPETEVARITTEPAGFLLHVWTASGGLASHLVHY